MLTVDVARIGGGADRVMSPRELGYDFNCGSDAQCEMLTQYYRTTALYYQSLVNGRSVDTQSVQELKTEVQSNDSGISVSFSDDVSSFDERSPVAETVAPVLTGDKDRSVKIKDGSCYLRMILPKWRAQTFQVLGYFPTLARLQSVLPHKFVSRFILKKIKLFRDVTGVICISDAGQLSAWDVLYFGEPVALSSCIASSDLVGGVATRKPEIAKNDHTIAGYCYLQLFEDCDKQAAKEKLGTYPTLCSMLSLSFGAYSKRKLWECGIVETGATLCHVTETKSDKMNALDILTAVAHATVGAFPMSSLGDGLRKRDLITLPSGVSGFSKCGVPSDVSFWACVMQYGYQVADFCASMLAYVHWPHDSAIVTMIKLTGSDTGVGTVVQHSNVQVKDGFQWYAAAMIDFGPHVNVENRETELVFERPANCVRWAVCIPAELPWCMFSNGQTISGGQMIIHSDQAIAIRLRVNLGKYSALSAVIMWSDQREETWGFSQLKNFYTVRLDANARL